MVALFGANQKQSTIFFYPGDLSGDINLSAVDYQKSPFIRTSTLRKPILKSHHSAQPSPC